MPIIMNMRNGVISGMLLVSVYAMDFFKLSNIKRPERKKHHIYYRWAFGSYPPFLSFSKTGVCNSERLCAKGWHGSESMCLPPMWPRLGTHKLEPFSPILGLSVNLFPSRFIFYSVIV